jgi:hypothetical protein
LTDLKSFAKTTKQGHQDKMHNCLVCGVAVYAMYAKKIFFQYAGLGEKTGYVCNKCSCEKTGKEIYKIIGKEIIKTKEQKL